MLCSDFLGKTTFQQACVLLHNMIIEDEREDEDDFNYNQEGTVTKVLEEFLKMHQEIEDKSTHEQLRNDLVEHLWAIHSSRQLRYSGIQLQLLWQIILYNDLENTVFCGFSCNALANNYLLAWNDLANNEAYDYPHIT